MGKPDCGSTYPSLILLLLLLLLLLLMMMMVSLADSSVTATACLQASVKEAGVAQRQAAAAYAEGKARDALVLANKQLESARHFDRVMQVMVLPMSSGSQAGAVHEQSMCCP